MKKNFNIDKLEFITHTSKNQYLKMILQKAFTHFYLTAEPIYFSAMGKKGTTIITVSVKNDAENLMDCTFNVRYKSDGDSQMAMATADFSMKPYYASYDEINEKYLIYVDAIAEALTSDFYERWL